MNGLLKLAYRNCFRHKKRSILTLLSVSVGIFVLLVSTTFINGIDETTRQMYFTTSVPGIKIYNRDNFAERSDLSLDYLIDDSEKILESLRNLPGDIKFSPRLKYRSRLISGANELITIVNGIDATHDASLFTLYKSIVAENTEEKVRIQSEFTNTGFTCLAGDTLMNELSLKPGDQIELYVRTIHNAHNAISFTIAGALHTNNPEIDSFTIVVKLGDAQILADTGSMVTEINIKVPHYHEDKILHTMNLINNILPPGLRAYTWQEELADMLVFFKMRQVAQKVIIIFLLILAITGVTNTMLMAVFERTKEIGTIAALGMKKKHIISLFMIEGAMLGLAGAFVSIVISLVPILLISTVGVTVPGTDSLSNMAGKIYGYIDWYYFPIAVITGMTVTSLATVYPSMKSVHLNVAAVLRGK